MRSSAGGHGAAPQNPSGAEPSLPGSTVAVVGLGLIGGSLVRAFAGLPRRPRVLGASRDAGDRLGAQRAAGVETSADARDVVREADIVVYAAPMGEIVEMLPQHAPLFRGNALVMDVAGLKGPVLEAARRTGLCQRFVGAHPMAGGESSGFDGARTELFRGARVWLCADPAVERAAAERAEAFWRALSAHPTWTDAQVHDDLMARVSHLPQLVANALALTLQAAGVAPDDLGPGGQDMTRLAESPPLLWAELLARSGPEVAELLRAAAGWERELAERLEAGDGEAVAALMSRSREWRRARTEPER